LYYDAIRFISRIRPAMQSNEEKKLLGKLIRAYYRIEVRVAKRHGKA
jgi:hypothetical protein